MKKNKNFWENPKVANSKICLMANIWQIQKHIKNHIYKIKNVFLAKFLPIANFLPLAHMAKLANTIWLNFTIFLPYGITKLIKYKYKIIS